MSFWRAAVVLLTSCGLAACGQVAEDRLARPIIGTSAVRAMYFFDGADLSWDTFTTPDDRARFRILSGVLEGAVVADVGYLWSLNNRRYSDVSVEATVQQVRGTPGNGFGLLCRADDDGNGYYFVISSAGQFAILKATPDAADPAQLVEWQPSALIRQGNLTNRLRADCVGDYLLFTVNGHEVADARDTTFNVGELGVVLAGVGETVRVQFDDILVRDAFVAGMK